MRSIHDTPFGLVPLVLCLPLPLWLAASAVVRADDGLASVELARVAPLEFHLVVTSRVAFLGGEVGIRFDRDEVEVESVRLGPDVSPPDGDVVYDPEPASGCPAAEDADGGVVIAWRHASEAIRALEPGTHRVVTITLRPAPGADGEPDSPLRFVRCLGVPGAPARCVVTDEGGRSVLLATRDGSTRQPIDEPFSRGDADGDGSRNITDAIRILEALFTGESTLPCLDAGDADDSGRLDITDAVWILRHLFSGGPPPPAPFPGCGADPTADDLGCAVGVSC